MDENCRQKSQQETVPDLSGVINLESAYDHTGHDEIQGDHRECPAFLGPYKMKFYQQEPAAHDQKQYGKLPGQ